MLIKLPAGYRFGTVERVAYGAGTTHIYSDRDHKFLCSRELRAKDLYQTPAMQEEDLYRKCVSYAFRDFSGIGATRIAEEQTP